MRITVLASIFFLNLLPLLSPAQTSSSARLTQLDSLLVTAFKNSNFQDAVGYANEALRLRTNAPVDSLYLQALITRAKAKTNLGAPGEAATDYRRVQTLTEQAPGKFALLRGEALNGLAITEINQGRMPQAMVILQQAQQLFQSQQKTQTPIYARTLNLLSLVSLQNSDLAGAEQYLLEAKSILEGIGKTEDRVYGMVLNDMGNLYRALAMHNQAESFYLQALAVLEKQGNKDILHYALTQQELGFCYMIQNKYSKAEEYYQQAAATIEQKIGKNSTFYTNNLAAMGRLNARKKDYPRAEALLHEAIALQKQASFSSPQAFQALENTLAYVYIHRGKLDEAEAILTKNIGAVEDFYSSESALFGLELKNLILLYIEKKDYDQALVYAMRAFDSNSNEIDRTATLSDEFIRQLPTHNYYCNETQMQLLRQFNRLLSERALQSGDEAQLRQSQALQQAIFQYLQRVRDESICIDDKMALLEENAEIMKCGIQTALAMNDQDDSRLATIFGIMEQNKMLLLNDVLKSRKAQHFGFLPEALAEQEAILQRKSDELRRDLKVAGKGIRKDSIQAAINDNMLQMKQFQQKIKEAHPQYYQYKYAASVITPQAVQKILPAKAALIEYFITDSLLYCVRLTADKMNFFSIPLLKSQLEEQIDRLRRALSDYDFIKNQAEEAQALYTETAHWFYQNTLAPALQNTDGIEHLIIVADGMLGNLPFETFLTQPVAAGMSYAQMPYLVQQYRISYSYSATLLEENSRAPRSNNRQVLGMAASYSPLQQTAAPQLAMRSASLRNLRASLSDLPSARQEVEHLQQHFAGEFLYDVQATEANFKRLAPQYGILHLAMHGILDAQQPILSSFAFTENEDSTEDNFLQAWEISHLKLNAELVVLSACETGYGKFQQGEGILSLARAFMYAGVPSMVVSQWEVNDASTAQIMQFFYKALATGMDKAQALRQAKLDYLANAKGMAAHPAYWSAFIQLGDSRAIEPAEKGGGGWWLYALTGTAMLGGIAMVARRKA